MKIKTFCPPPQFVLSGLCSDHELTPEPHPALPPPAVWIIHRGSCGPVPVSLSYSGTLWVHLCWSTAQGEEVTYACFEVCQVSSGSLLWAEEKWDHTVRQVHLLPCSWGQGRGCLCWESLEGTAGAQRYWGLPPFRGPCSQLRRSRPCDHTGCLAGSVGWKVLGNTSVDG